MKATTGKYVTTRRAGEMGRHDDSMRTKDGKQTMISHTAKEV